MEGVGLLSRDGVFREGRGQSLIKEKKVDKHNKRTQKIYHMEINYSTNDKIMAQINYECRINTPPTFNFVNIN